MNDRELRHSVVGLGGKAHGVPREHQFVITAASEVMAVFALANSLADLRRRLGRIVVASTFDGEPVTAEMLKVAGARTVIMKDAIAEPRADARGSAGAGSRRAVRQHRARGEFDPRRSHCAEARRLRHH